MVENPLETETLARLYLSQGHPEKALPIFERLLAQGMERESLRQGLLQCRAALARAGREANVDDKKRLRILERMLARLTGSAPPPEEPPAPTPALAAPRPSASERRLAVLQDLLKRLERAR